MSIKIHPIWAKCSKFGAETKGGSFFQLWWSSTSPWWTRHEPRPQAPGPASTCCFLQPFSGLLTYLTGCIFHSFLIYSVWSWGRIFILMRKQWRTLNLDFNSYSMVMCLCVFFLLGKKKHIWIWPRPLSFRGVVSLADWSEGLWLNPGLIRFFKTIKNQRVVLF